MQRQLIFLPAGRDDAASLAQGAEFDPPRPAFAVTGDLMVALGYEPDKVEEAEYAALVLASVWGLARYGERLVVVAEVPDDRVFPADDDDVELDNGAVRLGALPAGTIVSWFGDEAEAASDVEAAARAASGLGIDEAWDKPEVQALITGHDMLWHAGEELHLARRQRPA